MQLSLAITIWVESHNSNVFYADLASPPNAEHEDFDALFISKKVRSNTKMKARNKRKMAVNTRCRNSRGDVERPFFWSTAVQKCRSFLHRAVKCMRVRSREALKAVEHFLNT